MFLKHGKNLAAKLLNFGAIHFNGLHPDYKTGAPAHTAG